MANWGNMVITTRGKELEAKAHAHQQPIEFTKFKFGNGVIGQEQSYETMTDLVSPKMTLGVSRLEAKPGGGTLVGTVLTNAELNNGFKMFEAGLFAHDPDMDSDILYCVLTDNDPDYLPPKSGDAVISVDFSILILVDSKLQITAKLDPTSLLTLRDLINHDNNSGAHREAFNSHDANEDAHSEAFQQHNNDDGAHTAIFNNFVKNVARKSDNSFTVTKGNGGTENITINNVDNANTANYLKTNENGCIYHDLSKCAADEDVKLHVNWSAKDTTRKIIRYIFYDAKGTGEFADLQAKTVYANLYGNATSATKASMVKFIRGNEIVLAGTLPSPDYAWLGYRSEGYSGQPLKKWKMGDLTATGGLAAVEAKEFIGPATVLKGIYTQNGGKQPSGYFGRESVGALMSNEEVNGDKSYKDWLYLDTYSSTDAGGPTAIGFSRASTKAFIMRADSGRGAWKDSAELLTTKGGHTVAGNMVFNGTVTTKSGIIVPTRSRGDNTTYAASTAFVQDAISALINGAPGALDTLKELAAALGDDANFASTLTKQLELKAPLDSPSFTGTVTGPTPALEANNTQFATTAWVLQSIAAHATGPIIGDVSNANGWWVKIPCQGFNLLIQGGKTSRGRNLYVNFPISFKTIYTISVSMIGMATGSQSCVYIDEISNNRFRTGSYDDASGMKGVMWIAYGSV